MQEMEETDYHDLTDKSYKLIRTEEIILMLISSVMFMYFSYQRKIIITNRTQAWSMLWIEPRKYCSLSC